MIAKIIPQMTAHAILASAICTITLTGCSTAPQMDYSKAKLVSVSGTVTLDGEPLPNAVVTFESVVDGTFSFAQTNSSGKYTLQFDSQMSGVTPGQKKVAFSTTRKILGLNSDDESGGEGEGSGEGEVESATPTPNVELVPDCYNKDSKIQVEVTASTTTFNFDLKSDCSTTGATP
ncbi:MAG: carboxypeptidase regulatory-like domain-containing protein [Planctomycetaceae bacterium]|nr:carboxypeptidase regulatory-like domain-containing protein [Planctomycetaceae bacterium]